MENTLPEFCFLGIDHWSTCMTKSEWSGWMQAIFSVIAIFAAIGVALWQQHVSSKQEKDRSKAAARVAASGVLLTINQVLACIEAVSVHIEMLAGEEAFKPEQQIQRLQALRHPSDFERLALIDWAPICARELALGAGLLAEVEAALERISDALDVFETLDQEVVGEVLEIFSRAAMHYENSLLLLKEIAK